MALIPAFGRWRLEDQLLVEAIWATQDPASEERIQMQDLSLAVQARQDSFCFWGLRLSDILWPSPEFCAVNPLPSSSWVAVKDLGVGFLGVNNKLS